MLEEELVDLVKKIQSRKAEGQTIEVKKAERGCPKRLYDTLSSFSNQDSGGTIVFGIDEGNAFALTHIYDLQDLQKKVMEQCEGMTPPVRAVFTIAQIEGTYVCSAEIPGIDISERPCYYNGAGRYSGSYIRVGDADLRMTDYEIYSFEAYRKHLHDDERPIERASLEMCDELAVKQFLEVKRRERPGFMKLDDHKAYEMLNIMRDGHPTLAAIMNFGIYPQGYLPQCAIIAVVSPGREIGEVSNKGERFLDNKRIEGNISSMVQEALLFCKRNMKTQTVVDPITGNRTDETEYPMLALREAILNALIHRDYSIYSEGTAVQINIFYDRIEIHSPGNLYGRMTVEQLGIARPDLRNPALAMIAEWETEAENRYSGIPTMRREMAAYGLPEPVFENRRNEFVVTFYNESAGADTMSTKAEHKKGGEETLLSFCRTPRSRSEIMEFLHISTWFYANDKYVRPLLKEGKLRMTIPDKPKSKKQRYVAENGSLSLGNAN